MKLLLHPGSAQWYFRLVFCSDDCVAFARGGLAEAWTTSSDDDDDEGEYGSLLCGYSVAGEWIVLSFSRLICRPDESMTERVNSLFNRCWSAYCMMADKKMRRKKNILMDEGKELGFKTRRKRRRKNGWEPNIRHRFRGTYTTPNEPSSSGESFPWIKNPVAFQGSSNQNGIPWKRCF